MKYYRPGMISLVFIPILFVLFLKMRFEEKDLRVLKVNIPLPEFNDLDGLPKFDYNTLDDIRKNVHFERFSIENYNYAQLDSLFKSLKESQSNSAFVSRFSSPFDYGLSFKFNPNTSYDQFVTLISLCQKYGYPLFAHDLRHDEFYVCNQFDNSHSGTLTLCDIVKTGETKTFLKENTDKLQAISNQFKPVNSTALCKSQGVILAFLTLCLFSYKDILFSKNRKKDSL
jgi:hypothetical protein